MSGEDPNVEARLLTAAQDVFARKGRDGARAREIAEAAGVSTPTVNYYFRSKDQLYEAAFAVAFGEFARGLAGAIQEAPTFRAVLFALIEHFVTFYSERPAAVGLWVQENLAGGEVAARLIREGDGGLAFGAFVDAYRAAEAAGEVRGLDPHHLFVSVMGACLMLPIARPVLRATLTPLAEEPEWFESERAGHVFDLVWHSLAL